MATSAGVIRRVLPTIRPLVVAVEATFVAKGFLSATPAPVVSVGRLVVVVGVVPALVTLLSVGSVVSFR